MGARVLGVAARSARLGRRTFDACDGRRWEADRWNEVDGRHHFQAGHWLRDDSDRHGQ
jgi:hypothetical protein